MTALLIKLAIRVAVFAVVIAFATRVVSGARLRNRAVLPLVALVFAVLNGLLYTGLVFTMNLVTLWMLWFAVPFVANAALLWGTSKVIKPFGFDGLWALAKVSFIVTVAHVVLRFIGL
jgi:uncharacterized membrane protein YvlD (DUF360 family)